MKRFGALFQRLDETNRTNVKRDALVAYFADAPPEDAAWAVYFLIGRRFRRPVDTTRMRRWAGEATGTPEWLFEAAYSAVGDLAETIALLFPPEGTGDARPLHAWVEEILLPLGTKSDNEKKRILVEAWEALSAGERFVFTKLLTGAWRVGVSQRLVIRALSLYSGLEPNVVAQRLMGDWTPSADFFRQLVDRTAPAADPGRPYPFQLAHPLQSDPETLGPADNWLAEWKWDGIRAQVIKRHSTVYIWSRGEEFVTDRFPEIAEAAYRLPDGTVLDGEIVGWRNDSPLPFADLQKRIGRKQVSPKLLQTTPVIFLAFDLLENDGHDIRGMPLSDRRRRLEALVAGFEVEAIRLNETIAAADWAEREVLRTSSRERCTEGLMLKAADSLYEGGRPRGPWWKWKIDPYTIDAVMLYAQPGHGRRAGLFSDYTFGVWNGDELVPLAKAYSGLSDAELREVDRFVRANTEQRFGPVRQVTAQLVMELAFDGIRRSNRHKSGVALRFPRIHRWRRDLSPRSADTLETVMELLDENGEAIGH